MSQDAVQNSLGQTKLTYSLEKQLELSTQLRLGEHWGTKLTDTFVQVEYLNIDLQSISMKPL